MAVQQIPASAHIRRLNLAVTMRERETIRPLNRKGATGADVSEMWAGSIDFAPMSRQTGAAVAAFFESLDGRLSPFLVPLVGAFASQAIALSGTVAVGAAGSASTLTLALPAGTSIPAGTLIAIGDPQTAAYQWCEIVTDAMSSPSVIVDIAPRLRAAVSASTAVTLGSIYGKFALAEDKLTGFNAAVAATGLSVNVIEARA